jgi:hypothetical protein
MIANLARSFIIVKAHLQRFKVQISGRLLNVRKIAARNGKLSRSDTSRKDCMQHLNAVSQEKRERQQ